MRTLYYWLMLTLIISILLFGTPSLNAVDLLDDADNNGFRDGFEQLLIEKFCPSLVLNKSEEDNKGVATAPEPVEMVTGQIWRTLWDVNGAFCGDLIGIANGIFNENLDNDNDYGIDLPPATYNECLPDGGNTHFIMKWHLDYAGMGKECEQTGGFWETPDGWYDAYIFGREDNDYTFAKRGAEYPHTVYAHPFTDNGEFIIQYWFFYPFNDWVNNHEGDWEHINVVITSDDPSVAVIDRVIYYFHDRYKICHVAQSDNPDTFDYYIMDNSHPVVFVGGYEYAEYIIGEIISGRGYASHGSYPVPGTWYNVSIIPSILGLSTAVGLNDHVDGEGKFIPWNIFVNNTDGFGHGVVLIKEPDYYDYDVNPEMCWLKADIFWGHKIVSSMGTNLPYVPGALWESCRAPRGPVHQCVWNVVDSDCGDFINIDEWPTMYVHASEAGWTPPAYDPSFTAVVCGTITNENGEGVGNINVVPWPSDSNKKAFLKKSRTSDGYYMCVVDDCWSGSFYPQANGYYNMFEGNFGPHNCISLPDPSQRYELNFVASHWPEFYVDASNTDGPWLGSEEFPYKTIEDAFNIAVSGDTINVADGEYSVSGIHLLDNMTIRSINGNPENVIIFNILQNQSLFLITALEEKICFEGLTFRGSAPGLLSPPGMLVGDCPDTFEVYFDNCIFEKFSGNAIEFAGDGNLSLNNCRIRNNEEGYAINIHDADIELEINECKFIDNEDIIYLERHTLGPVVTLTVSGCEFSGNRQILNLQGVSTVTIDDCTVLNNNSLNMISVNSTIPGTFNISNSIIGDNSISGEPGVLVDIDSYENYSCQISGCSIFNNEAMVILEGDNCNLNISNSTFAGNGDEMDYRDCSIIDANHFTIQNCIFAFNDAGILGTIQDEDDISDYNCEHGNYQEHQLIPGPDLDGFVIYSDPMFCDIENTNYNVSVLSPCFNGGVDGSTMGAYDIPCVPQGVVTSVEYVSPDRGTCTNCGGPFVLGCPAGDGEYLKIVVDFPNNMDGEIAASEVVVDSIPETDETFRLLRRIDSGIWLPISADTHAVAPEYRTCVTHPFMSGGGTDNLFILLNGYPIDTLEVQIKTPDINGDRIVNMSDIPVLYSSYQKCFGQSGFNTNCDLNGDGCVQVSDIGILGLHLNKCEYTGYETPSMFKMPERITTRTKLKLAVNNSEGQNNGRILVDLSFDDVEMTNVILLSLEYGSAGIDYVSFEKGDKAPFEIVPVGLVQEGKKYLMIMMFSDAMVSGDNVEIGTLQFKENSSDLELANIANDFKLHIGQLLNQNGEIRTITNIEKVEIETPEVYKNVLKGNYPNPFNPATVIEYSIASDTDVSLNIYNVAGQAVKTLVKGARQKGNYKVTWDGKDNDGNMVVSGVYFYKLRTKDFVATRKMVLFR